MIILIAKAIQNKIYLQAYFLTVRLMHHSSLWG